MRHEPPIDHAPLLATIRAAYGLPVERLTFVPVGYAAACYRVARAGGESLFLKLWPPASSGTPHRPGGLRLTRALHEHGLLPRVPYPLTTREGALWATHAGIPFALFPFLPGGVPSPWTPALRDELARTIAAIHRTTPALADVLPPQDGFDLPWAAALQRGLAGLDALGPDARPGLRALRALVLPRRDEILAQLARLEGLRETVRHLRGPLVLCHTDIIGDNLLVDDQRRLSVLDWDEARVAPPEYDLYEVCDGDFARFLAVYCAAGGSGPLRLDHFAFALLRRAVGDMAVRLLSVVDEDRAPEVEAEALHGIEAWGFARWRGIDATLAALAPTLRQHDAHEQPSAET